MVASKDLPASSVSNAESLLAELDNNVLLMVFEQTHGFSQDGKSESLGGPHDRELIVSLRNWAEIIVTTVKTAEAESYRQPQKPLLLLTRKHSGADWLKAKRLDWTQDEFNQAISSKKALFETGLSSSRNLIELGFIDQLVIHHDQPEFDPQKHMAVTLDLATRVSYYDRYISIFQRRGRG